MSIISMVRERLEDDGEESLLDYVSEGDGEDIDSLEARPRMDSSFPSSVVITNAPKVGKDKYEKLMGVMKKFLDRYKPIDVYMPLNPQTETTEGMLIVTFESKESADTAVAIMGDNMKFDSKHVLKVFKLDRFDDITNREDHFEPQRDIATFSRADFRTWLSDKKCREQLLVRYQSETEIYWHDIMAGAPVLCYGGEREKRGKKIWCDWKVQWSPMGSYLTTFHQQGIALWAGPEFTKKVRFAHEGVKHIQFSPNEDYVLTWNGSLSTEPDDQAVRFHRVLTGECVKSFRTPQVAPLGGDFPHFLWSYDGKYFAECTETSIIVRDTETFDVIRDEDKKKKILKYDNLQTFQWSPRDNVIALWTNEKDNNPARLVLVEIPSGRELTSRSRTQVEASMHWQSEGDYLCLLNTKLSKTKKKGATNLEIFRIRQRNIPVDIVEVRDTVRGFYWETKGNRFAVLTTDDAGHHPRLLVYYVGKEKCEAIPPFDLPSNSFNQVFWAPEGQYFVCAAIGEEALLFGGITPDNKLEILHKDEHFMITDVQYDPSSRFIITAVTQPILTGTGDMGHFKYQMEAGYAIWTFQGRLMFRCQKEKLYQVMWRPHPPSLLPTERQRDIRKNIKQFSKKYDALDEQAKEAARQAFRQDRDQKTRAFRKVLDRLADFKEERAADNGWDEAWEEYRNSQGWEETTQTFEEELEVTEDAIE